jgi:hypothetical protein
MKIDFSWHVKTSSSLNDCRRFEENLFNSDNGRSGFLEYSVANCTKWTGSHHRRLWPRYANSTACYSQRAVIKVNKFQNLDVSFSQFNFQQRISWHIYVARTTDYVSEKFQRHHWGIKPATFRLVAQCLNQLRYRARHSDPEFDKHIRVPNGTSRHKTISEIRKRKQYRQKVHCVWNTTSNLASNMAARIYLWYKQSSEYNQISNKNWLQLSM